jgi:hypothetical protein
LRWLLRQQSWNPFSPEAVEFVELNFDFHPRAVKAWLEQVGFRVERLRSVSHFRWGPLKRLIPLEVLVALDAALQPTGQWWQLSPSVFVLSRATGQPVEPQAGTFWRCPHCLSLDISEEADGLRCQRCGRLWGKRGGVFDFKTPLEGDSSG